MKRIFVVLIVVMMMSPAMEAQGRGSDFSNAYILSAGLSLNYSYSYIGSRSIRIPPAQAYFEAGFHEYVTAGPFVGFSRWSYPERTRSFLNMGLRGSFHFSPLLNDLLDGSLNEQQIDLYAALLSGVELRQYGAGEGEGISGFTDNARIFIGPVAGLRFYFTDDLAVYSEIGRGALGVVSVGISMRLD